MSSPLDVDRYLDSVRARLQTAGFACRPKVNLKPWKVDFLASKKPWYLLTRMEYFLFFARFSSLSVDELQSFVTAALGFALHGTQVTMQKGIGVIGIALADDPDDLAVEHAEWGKIGPSSWGGQIALPVVVDATFGQIHYHQEKPILGAAFYDPLWKLIHKYLLPLR